MKKTMPAAIAILTLGAAAAAAGGPLDRVVIHAMPESAPTFFPGWTTQPRGSSTRFELELRRSDYGTYRFEQGHWTQACAAGRGHQDFTPDLCA